MSKEPFEDYCKKGFSIYRKERIAKECPMCSDLWHGYYEGMNHQEKKLQATLAYQELLLDAQEETEAELQAEREKVALLREAVEFYGDKYSWKITKKKLVNEYLTIDDSDEDNHFNDLELYAGKKARQALEKLKELEKGE